MTTEDPSIDDVRVLESFIAGTGDSSLLLTFQGILRSHERMFQELSTPPADDVREALALAIDPNALELNAYPWPLNAADRVLAAFEVRPRGKVTPTVDEWSEQMDAERARQIEHGYDDAHDAQHGAAHLLNWAIDYARRGNNLAAATMARCALRLPRGTVTDPEGAWEYGVRHVAVDGWPTERVHVSLEAAREDLDTCGMNCNLIRRRGAQGAGQWEPITTTREARS